jgi:hypothetical protein
MLASVNSPRIVFLDTNNWIELARGYHGRAPQLKTIVRGVSAASESGKVLFPISIVQFDETVKNLNLERRKRLAQFMLLVSKGWTILPATRIINYEIEDACRAYLGLLRLDLQKFAIKKGVSQMLGAKAGLVYAKPEARLPKNVEKDLLDAIDSQSTLLRSMTDWADDRIRRDSLKDKEEYARRIEAIRKNQALVRDKDRLHKGELAKLLLDMVPEITLFFYGIGQDARPFLEHIGADIDSIMNFFHQTPTSYCNVELSFYRDMLTTRKVQPNDLNDIMMLSIAIPYCDVVVTERMWHRAIVQTKLDVLRPTRVFFKLTDLHAWLEREFV